MFENVVMVGDSFAFGSELEDNNNSRYSALISKALNAKEYNLALGGLGCELISSYLITETSELLSKNLIKPENTLVIVNWSNLNRTCFYNKYNKNFLVSWGQRVKEVFIERMDTIKDILNSNHNLTLENLYSFFQSHTDEFYSAYNSFKYIYLAQCFLENNNFKYVFLVAHSETYQRLTQYNYEFTNLSKIDYDQSNIVQQKFSLNKYGYYLPDPKYFLDKINLNNFFNEFISDLTDKNNFKRGKGGHPLEQAHSVYSTLLLKHIKNKWELDV